MSIRVRFAPSPTGPLHIGGVRTALFNYLLVKKMGGEIILRIEDTDTKRFVSSSEQYIIDTFNWLNIKFDEGVHIGGLYEPYKQSERINIYRKFINILIDLGYAYYAFDNPDDLVSLLQQDSYNSITRNYMVNSLTLSPNQVDEKIQNNVPYVIRFKTPINKDIIFNDMVRGKITINSNNIDDKILIKSDGVPTYHFANVVDDFLMGITHVIRGEEWIPSTPLHIMLYDAFGWKLPKFAHLPLILKPEGKGKLSKRDSQIGNFPIYPLTWIDPITNEVFLGFKESGYLPEAVINYLSLLGWNDGSDNEIYSLSELINKFNLDTINKDGSRFDIKKLNWFNQEYIKNMKDDDLLSCFKEKLNMFDYSTSLKIIKLIKNRLVTLNDFEKETNYFLNSPKSFNLDLIKSKLNDETKNNIEKICYILKRIDNFSQENIKNTLNNNFENIGKVLPMLRFSLTGLTNGGDLMLIMDILGKDEVILRINDFIKKIFV